MKIKLTAHRIVSVAVVFMLLIFIVFVVCAVRLNKTSVEYGITDGTVTYIPMGTDITENILSSEASVEVISRNGKNISIDSMGYVSFFDGEKTHKLCNTQNNFTSDEKESASVFSINYLDDKGSINKYYSSEAVSKKQIRIYRQDNCINVQYLLGEEVSSVLLPQVVEKDKFEERILSKCDSSDKEFLKRQYFLYSLESFEDENEKNNILLTYPILKEHDIYVLLNSTDSQSLAGKRISSIMEKVGYTYDDILDDNKENLNQAKLPLSFLVTLSYSLEEDGVTVTLPIDKLCFYQKTPILSVDLLKYTVSLDDEQNGALFLPFGTGSVVKINKTLCSNVPGSMKVSVYGDDNTEMRETISSDLSGTPKCTLPLFGSYAGSDGVLTIIEDGASQAQIISQRNENGGFAYTAFEILQFDSLELSGKTASVVTGNDIVTGNISLKYAFINDESGVNYSDFAEYYHNYLLDKNIISEKNSNQGSLFFAEFIGSITVDDAYFNTFPYDRFVTLSGYDEMINMAKTLNDMGVKKAVVKLSGWNKGGLFAQYPGRVKQNNNLLKGTDLKKLVSEISKNSSNVFVGVGFPYYYNLNSKEGTYNRAVMSAMRADKSYASFYSINPATGVSYTSGDATEVVSPFFYNDIAKKYINNKIFDNSDFDVENLALVLNSDYNSEHYIDRGGAQSRVEETLKTLAKGNKTISCNDANMYALPYISVITDVGDNTSLPDFVDMNIPFKQMVLRGSIDYKYSLNAPQGTRYAVLKAIESGAGLSCKFIYRSDIELKNTDYSYLNNYLFDNLCDAAAEAYKELESALRGLEGIRIMEHNVSDNDVVSVVYENGTLIYINYSNTSVDVNGVTVDSLSWHRIDY